MQKSYEKVKYGCYFVGISMAIIANFPPLLFMTFRSLYGISYSQIGLLVVINFVTQLSIDLIFSFFSHKFNIPKTVKITPALAIVGLIIYAVSPFVMKNVYVGLLAGTVIFSASGGLAEVLMSPVIAEIPSDNPEREMSKLHSMYAWGVVGVVFVSTAYILIFGAENWQHLTFVMLIIPLLAVIFLAKSEIPDIKTPEKVSGLKTFLKNKTLWLCVFAIFLGGASECTMAQWCSGYLEKALLIPKFYGDIFGVALFSVMLGLGRSLYAKYGQNIGKVLILGAVGASGCYLTAALFSNPFTGLLACAFTGFCVSMMWPGSLLVASDKFSSSGVFIYAIMASGGDLGASVGSQFVGVITDIVIENEKFSAVAENLLLTPEQLGMKLGMLVGAIFPFVAIFVFRRMKKLKG